MIKQIKMERKETQRTTELLFESQNYKTTNKKTDKGGTELVPYRTRYIRDQAKDTDNDNRERKTRSHKSREAQIRKKTKMKTETQRRK